jgi:hypothetical protein
MESLFLLNKLKQQNEHTTKNLRPEHCNLNDVYVLHAMPPGRIMFMLILKKSIEKASRKNGGLFLWFRGQAVRRWFAKPGSMVQIHSEPQQ